MAKVSRLKNIHKLIEAAVETLPPNESFLRELTATIERGQDDYIPSKTYKPSSMKCIRNMYFQVTGEKPDPSTASSELIGMGEIGSFRHEILQGYISKMYKKGFDCKYIDVAEYIKIRNLDYLEIRGKQGFETKLYNKALNISFLCDGILLYNKQYYILEIKTESMYKWQGRRFIAEEHIPQATAYSVSLGIDKVLFLYENRDLCGKKAYILNITEEMKYDNVISVIETCDEYVKKLVVPPKPENLNRKTCEYCGYITACRRAGNE